MSLPPDIGLTLASLKEGQDRIESNLKTKDKKERIIKWGTLLATICSTVILGVLTWVAQDFQRTVAALAQIHDLSSDDEDVRFGAERFLARSEYSDLAFMLAMPRLFWPPFTQGRNGDPTASQQGVAGAEAGVFPSC
jgi:hypothetical protein